ncbi:DNA-binding protein [Enterococcus sp. DIV0800]|uniref:DNA-binding protein n=1 Tax=unclassified Enterococcus TaxID=2608891 RepID=UPI003D2FB2DC
MQSMEETLATWRKDEFNQALQMMKQAIEVLSADKDIVKQGEAAKHFSVSVNTLKDWVLQGAPEIRLDSGMPMYSKKAITEWLLSKQK